MSRSHQGKEIFLFGLQYLEQQWSTGENHHEIQRDTIFPPKMFIKEPKWLEITMTHKNESKRMREDESLREPRGCNPNEKEKPPYKEKREGRGPFACPPLIKWKEGELMKKGALP